MLLILLDIPYLFFNINQSDVTLMWKMQAMIIIVAHAASVSQSCQPWLNRHKKGMDY